MTGPKKSKFLDSFPNHVYRYIDSTGEGRPPISSKVKRDDLNKIGYDSYFTVNGFKDSIDARKDNCTSINSFFIDIDGRKDIEELETIKNRLMPSFILETKNGFHLYWLLDEPIFKDELSEEDWKTAVSKWERIEECIVKDLNADPVVKDITRILRVPDTFYWKKSGDMYKNGTEGVFVIKGIHKDLSARYTIEEVSEAFSEAEDSIAPFPKTPQGESMQKYADSEKKMFFEMVNKEYPIEDRPSFRKLISGADGTLPPNIRSRNQALLVASTLMRQAGWTKSKAISQIESVGWHGIEKERGGRQEIVNTINSAYSSGYTYSYKNEVIAFNMTPEEQLRIQAAYSEVSKKRKDIDKARFSNYEYEVASRYPYLKKNEVGIVFNYENGVYKMLSDQDLSNIILSMLYEDMLWGYRTKRCVSDKVACLVSIIPDLVLTEDKGDYFNCKNGLYQISTGQLKSHTPDFVSLVQSPVAYDPSAEAPTWHACLDAWMDGPEKEKKIELLQQFSGYLLSSSMVYAKALFLVGDGGNGKSTFADTLGMVIGEQGTSRIDMEDLYSMFGLKGLIGKRLNIIEEVGGNYYQSHKLKKLISGEELTINMKYKDQFKFRPQAKFIFAVNTMPRVDDSSTATERRMSVVQFNNNFRNSPNTSLRFSDGLLAQELSGILNWMIEGINKLNKQKKFTITREQQSALTEYREENSSVEGFIGECLSFIDGSSVSVRELYLEYKDYCVRDGRKFKSAIAFTKEMKAYGPRFGKFQYVERSSGHGSARFEGISIDSEWSPTSMADFSSSPVRSPYTKDHDEL